MRQATPSLERPAPMRRAASAGALAGSVAESSLLDRPALAGNVQLVGELQVAAFQQPQWLVQRDGHFLQVSELLYRVAEQVNGERTLEEIADAVTESSDWLLTADTVRQIIGTKLVPLGVIAATDAPAHSSVQYPLALGMNLRARAIGAGAIEPIAGVLQVLYSPFLLLPIVLTIGLAHEWLYLVHGVYRGFAALLSTPVAALAVVAILVAGNVFHEFGHASALRHGGGRARGMGVGLYLIYPAFYTDTTDSYRLGRWARVRTDLGGFYFHLIFATAVIGIYLLLRQEWLLVVAFVIDLDILYQLLPFVRFDGYWAFADLTGIPDLFSQIGPFVRSVVPVGALGGARPTVLKPWVRLAFGLYIAVAAPVLVLLGVVMLAHLPQLAITARYSFWLQSQFFVSAWHGGDLARAALAALQILLLALQVGGLVSVLYFQGSRAAVALWKWSKPTPPRRLAGAVAVVAVIVLLLVLWLPRMPFA
jgi:putative peptide zinc metalloprotease protein